MRYAYGLVPRFLPHGAGRAGLLACLFWALIGAAFGQAAPSWSLVPKAAETAAGISYSYSPSAAGNAVSTVGRAVSTAANDAFVAAESATLSTPAGQATVSLARGFTGAAARGALADAAIAIGRGGVVGAGIAAGAALAPLLEGWMLDQGYHKNADGTWGVGSPATPVSGAYGAWCYGALCESLQGSSDYLNAYSRLMARAFPHLRAIYGCGPNNFNGVYLPSTLYTVCGKMDTRDDSVGGDDVYTDNVVANRYNAGASMCPDGSPPVAGMCGGGGPPSLSPADVHAAAAAAPNPVVADWQTAFDTAATLGYSPPMDYTPAVSGPDTITGTSTVTSTRTITQPDGSTQTLTETSQQVSHLTYSGSQVAVDTHTVTSTQNPDGSTTKTDKPTATAPDACAGFPGILGCTQLGTPEAASVPTASKAITFTAESISLPSACPAPIAVAQFGYLSFQTACDSAGYMRPLILAGSAITALMICMAAVAGVKT